MALIYYCMKPYGLSDAIAMTKAIYLHGRQEYSCLLRFFTTYAHFVIFVKYEFCRVTVQNPYWWEYEIMIKYF